MRIVVTGSREWVHRDLIAEVLAEYHPVDERGEDMPPFPTLVHGNARGVDKYAAEVARELGWTVESHPARWSDHDDACPAWHFDRNLRWCPRAGHRRNMEMLATNPNLVLAFIRDNSRGASGCVRNARDMHIPVREFTETTLFGGEVRLG